MRAKVVTMLAASIFSLALAGCGNSGRSGDPPSDPPSKGGGTGTGVIVTPSGIGQVWQGTTVQFTAAVMGQGNQAVTWTVHEGSAGGTIDSTGLYTAPANVPNPPSVTVTATLVAAPSKTASATLTIVQPGPSH